MESPLKTCISIINLSVRKMTPKGEKKLAWEGLKKCTFLIDSSFLTEDDPENLPENNTSQLFIQNKTRMTINNISSKWLATSIHLLQPRQPSWQPGLYFICPSSSSRPFTPPSPWACLEISPHKL